MEGTSRRFGSEDGSFWLVELSRVDGAATLSSGWLVGSGDGQETNSCERDCAWRDRWSTPDKYEVTLKWAALYCAI